MEEWLRTRRVIGSKELKTFKIISDNLTLRGKVFRHVSYGAILELKTHF